MIFCLGLALFWNYYFSNLFYKDKKVLLETRSAEIVQMDKSYEGGTLSSRELRFGLRLISRSFNGQIWIADENGLVKFASSPDAEGKLIPKQLDSSFAQALKNIKGFTVNHLEMRPGPISNTLTYSFSINNGGKTVVVFLNTPVEDITDVVSAVRLNIWIPQLFALIVLGIMLFVVSRRLTGPLQQMKQASLALAEGDFSTRVDPASHDEIGQLAISFNFMAEQLELWEDTRQEFLTNISHELRSPLTSLRGLIAAINDGVIPKDQIHRYMKICDQEVQRLQRLVQDILELAKIQNSTDVFRIVRVDAVQKTRETIDMLLPAAQKKELELELFLPSEHDPAILVELDPDRYAQIINNLIYNAMQFTPSGNKITVSVLVEEEQFVLRIRDTGIGMSEEEVKRVWERFYKADPSRGLPSEGTGLGLTITRHLVAGLKGTVFLASQLGVGTEFTVTFPLAD